MRTLTIPVAPRPWGGDHEFLDGGKVSGPDEHFLVAHECHKRTPKRYAAHEALGAVNRIDHPRATTRAGRLPEFLAEDAVVREVLGNPRARSLLGFAVGNGHR